MSKLKTKMRCSFVVDLDEINRQRKMLGHATITEQDLFEMLDGEAVVTLISHKHVSETITTRLGYIVI